MVGASKIDETTDDLERLFDLFELGLNNSQIAREYKTNAGKSLSRIHISAIRRGQRWNPQNRSFMMKSELGEQSSIRSVVDGLFVKTLVSQVVTDFKIYYIYLTYIDGKPTLWKEPSLMENRPRRIDLVIYHFDILNELTRKNS